MESYGEDQVELGPVEYEVAIACVLPPGHHTPSTSPGLIEVPDYVVALQRELRACGLVVEGVSGTSGSREYFLKVGALLEVIGKQAQKLHLRKVTALGIEAPFEWSQRDAYDRQPYDAALFSQTERYHCLETLILGIKTPPDCPAVPLKTGGERWLAPGTSFFQELLAAGAVKDLFPLHSELMRGQLIQKWALNVLGFDQQPLDAIYAYFGAKVAVYFAFLGLYTRWLLIPAALGLLLRCFGKGRLWHQVTPPLFAIATLLWAVLFLQFWRRRNTEFMARWELSVEGDEAHTQTPWEREMDGTEARTVAGVPIRGAGVPVPKGPSAGAAAVVGARRGLNSPAQSQPAAAEEWYLGGQALSGSERELVELVGELAGEEGSGEPITKEEKRVLRKEEWLGRLLVARNNLATLAAILCIQLPFELGYAHFFRKATGSFSRYALMACYLFLIRRLTALGGVVAQKLNKTQRFVSAEAAADSLVYKVFTIHFLQSYAGLFYHAFAHRDFERLRSFLFTRMLVNQIVNNVFENLIPFLTYLMAERGMRRKEQQAKAAMGEKSTEARLPRIMKEYLLPKYEATIGFSMCDGSFNDFLELAIQFGVVTMFACVDPLVAFFALINNVVELRADAFKLLCMHRRPVPHSVASIGAWLTIFQSLGVAAVVTNSLLLLLICEEAGTWKGQPLAALVFTGEHLLLLFSCGIAWLVPREPAWVAARRLKRARVQELYVHQIAKSVSMQISTIRRSRSLSPPSSTCSPLQPARPAPQVLRDTSPSTPQMLKVE